MKGLLRLLSLCILIQAIYGWGVIDFVQNGWEKTKEVGQDIADKGKEVGQNIVDTGKEVGQNIADKGKEVGQNIADKGKEVGQNIVNKGREAVGQAYNAVATYVPEAVEDAISFIKEKAPVFEDMAKAMTDVVTLAKDEIQMAARKFRNGTWKNLKNDAKMVLTQLQETKAYEEVVGALSAGANFVGDVIKAGKEASPYPLNVFEAKDFVSVSKCIGKDVYDLAKDWTKEIATTVTKVEGVTNSSDLNFEPLLNTEGVQEQLNETYGCLREYSLELQARRDEKEAQEAAEGAEGDLEKAKDKVIKVIKSAASKAQEWMKIDNLTVSIEFSFTACTVTCGTVGLGFAVSVEDRNMAKPYYTVAMGVDSSSVVGAAIGVSLNFYPSFETVVAQGNVLSFGTGIPIPLIGKLLPDVGVDIVTTKEQFGKFRRFTIESNLLSLRFGLTGAFSVGFSFTTTSWIYTTDDLRDAWKAVKGIVKDKKDTVTEWGKNFDNLTKKILGKGGYFLEAPEDKPLTLYCPSGLSPDHSQNENIGNLSVLNLGILEIYDVVWGNIKDGEDPCNGSYAYNNVYEKCQHSSKCNLVANSETLGGASCETRTGKVKDRSLTVIYGCPYQIEAYNLGCYGANLKKIIDSNWLQDHNDPLLQDGWKLRSNGLAKCAKIAADKGWAGFAMYNGGMCIGGADLFEDGKYNAFDRIEKTDCPINGLGSDVMLNLYAFAVSDVAFDDMGCVDKAQFGKYDPNLHSSFESMEGKHHLLQDNAQKRPNAVSKCAQVSREIGKKGFALFNDGECFVSDSFRDTVIDQVRQADQGEGEGEQTHQSCSKGEAAAYNVYQFPYLEYDEQKQKEGLTALEIGLIIGGSVLFVALVVGGVLGVIWCRKRKDQDSGFTQSTANGDDYVMMARR